MRYYSPFPVAIPQRRARSHALLTRPPLDPKVSLDLHVLGLPPAFVLSQDQTLKLKRLSASLTVEPLHISHIGITETNTGYLCLCASATKVAKAVQTVKLTLHHRDLIKDP